MTIKGFSYPSEIVCVDVNCEDERRHFIHECILLQLPYFETELKSGRWSTAAAAGEGVKCNLRLTLPPLSSHKDFNNTVIESLYRCEPLKATVHLKRAIGVYTLVTMLQSDELEEQALSNLCQVKFSNKCDKTISILETYDTLQKASAALVTPSLICMATMKKTQQIGEYRVKVPRILISRCGRSVRDYPQFVVNHRFNRLWRAVRNKISTRDQFITAYRIFRNLYKEWNFEGSHSIRLCVLIPSTSNSFRFALHDLLRLGVDLLQDEMISLKELFKLLDVGSPKVTDTHSDCEDEFCRSLRAVPFRNCIALDDSSLADFVELFQTKIEGSQAVDLAKHVLTSSRWGMQLLGPLTTRRVQKKKAPT